MKITGATLFTHSETGEQTTKLQFTDGIYQYEMTMPVKGNFTNGLSFLETKYLNTLTEYELIQAMTDLEAQEERLFAMEQVEELMSEEAA